MILASMRNPEGRMDKCDLGRRVCLAVVERCQYNKLECDMLKGTAETKFSVVLWHLMGLRAMVIRRWWKKEHETANFRGRTKININRQTPWLKGDLQKEMSISSYSESFKSLIHRLQRRHFSWCSPKVNIHRIKKKKWWPASALMCHANSENAGEAKIN